jgi:hypothetical protein
MPALVPRDLDHQALSARRQLRAEAEMIGAVKLQVRRPDMAAHGVF